MSRKSDAEGPGIDGLFARAKAGDQAAWVELFHACDPKVRRVVSRELRRMPLRTLYDSTDFTSDVWKSLAAKFGRYDFESVDEVVNLMAHMARLKVIDEYRRQTAKKNDMRRNRPIGGDETPGEAAWEPEASGPTASQEAVAEEALERLMAGLTHEQQFIVRLRLQDQPIPVIAAITGWNVRRVQRFLQELRESWQAEGGRP